jgi:hypothetical protein
MLRTGGQAVEKDGVALTGEQLEGSARRRGTLFLFLTLVLFLPSEGPRERKRLRTGK